MATEDSTSPKDHELNPGTPNSEQATVVRKSAGRNDPCPCGSGKKYKKCCLQKDEEAARQAAAAQREKEAKERAERLRELEELNKERFTNVQGNSALSETQAFLAEPPSEAELQLDRLWDNFNDLTEPTAAQMDEFLSQLVTLDPEGEEWNDVLQALHDLKHPNLPAVFRRIATAVPHKNNRSLAFFYWGAAEIFTKEGARELLPEVAANFCRVDVDSHDPDALANVVDYLLAYGFDLEALQLLEHFLPQSQGATDFRPPHCGNLIFLLRVGQQLRNSPTGLSIDTITAQLRSNIEKYVHEDSARTTAEAIAGDGSSMAWEKAQFDLRTGNEWTTEQAWLGSLRLFGTLVRVAQEEWQIEQRPPGSSLYGLALVLHSVYEWRETHKKGKAHHANLLDYLPPNELKTRLTRQYGPKMEPDEPQTILLIEAHETLGRSALRHEFITSAEFAEMKAALSRLRGDVDP